MAYICDNEGLYDGIKCKDCLAAFNHLEIFDKSKTNCEYYDPYDQAFDFCD